MRSCPGAPFSCPRHAIGTAKGTTQACHYRIGSVAKQPADTESEGRREETKVGQREAVAELQITMEVDGEALIPIAA